MLAHRTRIPARHQSFSAALLQQRHGVAHNSIAQAHILDNLPFADAQFSAWNDSQASFMLLVGAHRLGVFLSMFYEIPNHHHGSWYLEVVLNTVG